MHSPYRLMSIKTPLCLALFASTLLACAPGSYLTPPESDDPWTLIRHARTWLEQGRPRGALPTLQKALNEAERLEPGADDTLHTQAAIYNELGRAYEMASELPLPSNSSSRHPPSRTSCRRAARSGSRCITTYPRCSSGRDELTKAANNSPTPTPCIASCSRRKRSRPSATGRQARIFCWTSPNLACARERRGCRARSGSELMASTGGLTLISARSSRDTLRVL